MATPPTPAAAAKRIQTRQRQEEALRLKIAGATYQQIADQLGYSNRGSAAKAVQSLLDRHEFEGVEAYRHIELARREDLYLRLRASIASGDVPAIRAANRILDSIDQLLGLRERPGMDMDELHNLSRTLARQMAEAAGIEEELAVKYVEGLLRGEEVSL
jgi:hypothetical protein